MGSKLLSLIKIVDAKRLSDYPSQDMEEIESVIFDWGGVLIEDPAPGLMQYCSEALRVAKEEYTKTHCRFAGDFQKGKISEDTFWERICGELQVAKPQVDSLWGRAFAAVYSPKTEMFSLSVLLRKRGYKIALLSNTEGPAMQYFHQQKYDMFDVLVFSCAEGVEKPEKRIYELVLERLGTQTSQSVFIDDKPEYINATKAIGLNTIVFENIEQVKNELRLLGIKID